MNHIETHDFKHNNSNLNSKISKKNASDGDHQQGKIDNRQGNIHTHIR